MLPLDKYIYIYPYIDNRALRGSGEKRMYQVIERESGVKVGPAWKTHNEALRYCLAEMESDRASGYYEANFYRIVEVDE